jgi:hypothetical protein
MRSLFCYAWTILTLGIAAMIGSSGKKTGPPTAPADVTLLVPAMN